MNFFLHFSHSSFNLAGGFLAIIGSVSDSDCRFSFSFFWDSEILLTLLEMCFSERCLESLSESESLELQDTGPSLGVGFTGVGSDGVGTEDTGADVVEDGVSEGFSSAVWNIEW